MAETDVGLPPLALLAKEGCLHLEAFTDAELAAVRPGEPGYPDDVLAEALRALVARNLLRVEGDDLRPVRDLAVFLGAIDAADRTVVAVVGGRAVAEPEMAAYHVSTEGYVLEDRLAPPGLHHAAIQPTVVSVAELLERVLGDEVVEASDPDLVTDEAAVARLVADADTAAHLEVVWRTGDQVQATSAWVVVGDDGAVHVVTALPDLSGPQARRVDRVTVEAVLAGLFGLDPVVA